MTRNSFQTEPVRGAKSVLVMFFLFLLLYSFDFLRIFKDGVHNKKNGFALSRGSDIKCISDTTPPTPLLALCCDRSASHSGECQDSEADLLASRKPSEGFRILIFAICYQQWCRIPMPNSPQTRMI